MWHRCKCEARKKPMTVISELYSSDYDENSSVKIMIAVIVDITGIYSVCTCGKYVLVIIVTIMEDI